MKRRIIAVISFSLLVCVLFTSCGSKQAHTASEFKSALSGTSMSFIDKTNEWSNVYQKLSSVQSATSSAGTYEVLFFTFETSSSANMAYDKMTATAPSDAKFSEGGNYDICTASTSTNYYYTTRVDNTVLKIDVKIAYKNEVREIIKELKY